MIHIPTGKLSKGRKTTYGTNANRVGRLNKPCIEPIKIIYETNFFFLKPVLLRVCVVTLLLVQDDGRPNDKEQYRGEFNAIQSTAP